MSKKFTIFAVSAAAAIGAVVLFFPEKSPSDTIPKSVPVDASTQESRLRYFALHGWSVSEISEKDITIPSDFSVEYEQYAQIQDKQGLPLREYAGRPAKIYVYEVNNYEPQNNRMLAELLVCDDTAVASLIYNDNGGELRLSVS